MQLKTIVGMAVLACAGQTALAGYEDALGAHRRGDSKALLREVREAVENRADRGYETLIRELYISKKASSFEYGSYSEKRAALDLLAAAASDGPAQAQYEMGALKGIFRGGLDDWAKAATAGHAQAQYEYALAAGEQGKISRTEEFDWIERSAGQGYLSAQRRMVDIHLQKTLLDYRDVVRADPRKAFEWVKHIAGRPDLPLAARSRDISALAWMYFEGIGVEKNYCESFRLFESLLDGGHEAEGENGLWRFYRDGLCVSADAEKAELYLQRTRKRNPPVS